MSAESPTQSLRQTGLRAKGQVVRGAAAFVSTPATIPSKFETTLHHDVHEPKAFGSSSFRFEAQAPQQADGPGPGAYYAPRPFERKSDSFSKKGYGPLASRSKRSTRTLFGIVSVAPGPGRYDVDPKPVRRPSPPTSSSFARPVTLAAHAPPPPHPGPGEYDPTIFTEITRLKKLQGPSSAFASATQRGIPLPAVENPPPGAYDTTRPLGTGGSYARQRPTAAFRASERREPRPTDGPGPGAYDLTRSPSAPARSATSVFQRGAVDRFGHPVKPQREAPPLPGPGAYNVTELPRERQQIGSSFFLSGSERLAVPRPAADVPGPGAYKPGLMPTRKSFHLNATARWM